MTVIIVVFGIIAMIGVGVIGCICGLIDARRDTTREGGDWA